MLQLTAPPGLSLNYQPECDILHACWQEDQDLAAMQTTYRALLSAAQAVGGTCYWLLDMRRRGAVCPNTSAWVMQKLLPTIAPTLGATPHLAYLSSPVQLGQLREYDVAPPEPSYFEADFWMGMFLDEDMALEWLAQQRHRWKGISHGQPARCALTSRRPAYVLPEGVLK